LADKGPALLVLIKARAFANKHNLRIWIAFTGNGIGGIFVKRAFLTLSDLFGKRDQLFLFICFKHCLLTP